MQTTNIIISGVGGQGIILAGRILAQCAFASGKMVKMNELHGMAQRGGSVISHLRFGDVVHSPLIPKGKCDFLLALEELEGLRCAGYLKPGARVILNKRRVLPSGLSVADYPADIKTQLTKNGFQVDEINAPEIAREAGNIKTENIVLLGRISRYLPFKETTWQTVIKESVPQKTIDVNIIAFGKGRS